MVNRSIQNQNPMVIVVKANVFTQKFLAEIGISVTLLDMCKISV